MIGIGGLMAMIAANTAPLRQGLGEAEKAVQDSSKKMSDNMSHFERSLDRVGKTTMKLGQNMSKYVSLPLAGLAAGAFKMSMGFESSMSKIVGLVGVASDQVQEWGKDILKIAPQLGRAPAELADALFFVTSAGIRGAEAMEVLELSAKAAASGLGETKVVADLVTSAMNAYGVENLNATEATDILVAAVREGKTEAQDLAATMGQVLPIASELGVSFDQVGAAQAAMTRTGTNAATASTQLRAILTAAIRPTNQAEEALAGMGLTSEKLRKTIQDDGLLAGLQMLSQGADGNVEKLGKLIPNVRALSGFLDLMGKNAEDNVDIFESLGDATGALDDAFKAASETSEFAWNQAMESSKAAMIALGLIIKDSITPILRGFASLMMSLTNWITGLNETTQRWIVTIGAIVIAIGPVLTVLGFLATSVIPKLIIGVKLARTAFLALNTVIMANPFVAVATAITAVAAALLLFRNRSDEAADSQRDLLGSMQDVNDEIAQNLIKSVNAFDMSKASNGMLQFKFNADKLIKTLTTLNRGELQSLEKFLKKNYEEATRDAANATDALNKSAAQESMNQYSKALAAVTEELEKFTDAAVDADKAVKPTPGLIASLTQELEELGKQRLTATTLEDIARLNDLIQATEDRLRSLQQMSLSSRDVEMTATMTPQQAGPMFSISQTELGAMSQARATLSSYNRQVENLAPLSSRASEAVAQIGMEMQLVDQTINRLIESGLSPMDSAVVGLIDRYDELSNAQWTLRDDIEMVSAAITRMLSDLLGAAIESFTAIIAGSTSFVDGMNQMIRMVGGMFKELGYLFLAQGIAAKAFGESLSNPYTAIVAGLALIAAGAAVEAFVAEPPKMAEGGIVPPGFPNDTYLAYLSSGEMVVPDPIPLPHVTDIGKQQGIDVNVYGQLVGEDLKLSSERFDRRKELVE